MGTSKKRLPPLRTLHARNGFVTERSPRGRHTKKINADCAKLFTVEQCANQHGKIMIVAFRGFNSVFIQHSQTIIHVCVHTCSVRYESNICSLPEQYCAYARREYSAVEQVFGSDPVQLETDKTIGFV